MPNDTNPIDTAPADRFCDVVMKGGITSGVVYPRAILELARSYRFHSIGGTSVGAIAAVLTAAAEYRRRSGSMAGYEALGSLPEALGQDVGSRTRLESLFQPIPSTARLLTAFLSSLNRESTAARWWGVVAGCIRAYRSWALAGSIVALLAWFALAWVLGPQGAVGPAIVVVIGFVAGMLTGIYLDVTRGLVPNGFGLCKCGPGTATEPALVPWLHRFIQDTAGLAPDGPPLTFRHLWKADGFPPTWLPEQAGDVRSIDLQIFTTNLTHGRPYHFPLQDDTSRLFFKEKEMAEYFPADVVAHMVRCSAPYRKGSHESDPDPERVDPDLFEMPFGELPVVVAARLSLSFPLLVSAVPLWAIDYEAARKDRTIRRCWFSDGGICSNFPIHLFDRFVPMWPTFGITLGSRNVYRPDMPTWLPDLHTQGRADTWDRFSEKPDAIGRLGGFLASIVNSARSWNDLTVAHMPGSRDRIVHVRLDEKKEGGLNLKMTKDTISTLAGYGQEAGGKLRGKFAVPDGDAPNGNAGLATGWNEHRWVRFNVVLSGLRDRLQALGMAAEETPYTLPISRQIRKAEVEAPLRGKGEKALSGRQARALDNLLAALKEADEAFARADEPQPYEPVPKPTIRMRPPL